jgi:hypothetical protein
VIRAEPFCWVSKIVLGEVFMKKLLFALVLLASATLFAQSPFDGTWITKLDTAKFPTKPGQFSLKVGIRFTQVATMCSVVRLN